MGFNVQSTRPATFGLERIGIATEYGGRRFRSRLEARWACFFDLLKWPFEYEPIDLAGYVPDYILPFKRGSVLAEVKPATDRSELEENGRKVTRGGWRGDFMIVGARIFTPEGSNRQRTMGLLSLWDRESNDGWYAADDAIIIRCKACRLISLCHSSAGWFCLLCGADDHRVHFADLDYREVDSLWAQAGNMVQWQPRAR
jgi:hypothetical protein